MAYQTGGARYLRIELTPDWDDLGKVKGVIALVSDLTKKKNAEDALKESEERLRTLMTLAPVGIYQTDAEGNCLMVNERWRQMTGLSFEETQGPGWVKALHPDDRERVVKEWYAAAQENREFQSEYRFRTPAGVVTEIRGGAIALTDERGQTKGYIGTTTDVTELREAIRARDEFVSIASHELKTPLTSLKLRTQVLRHKFKKGSSAALSEENVLKLVDTTEEQVGRLVRLVEDMLDIARIQTRKLTIEKSPVDLCLLAEQVVERLSIQTQASGSRIQFQCDPPITGLWDGYRIEQVLTNLLSNALKYGAGKPVEVSAGRQGDRAILSVRDHGIGIAYENQDKIFRRFERAVSHHSISGLGLGLYIVKQIVDTHQGTIRVQSELGQGSTFTVELPLNEITRDEEVSHVSR